MDDPRARFFRDHGRPSAVISILQRSIGAHGERLVNPLSDALASGLHRPRDSGNRFTPMITAQNPRTLNLS